jgi:hypothetical protein
MSDITINDLKIEDFLNSVEIVKIYKGKDDYCRCGCGASYRYTKLGRITKNVIRAFHELRAYGDEKHKFRYMFSSASNSCEGYINIPIYNERNPKYNQCYCIYFKNKIS